MRFPSRKRLAPSLCLLSALLGLVGCLGGTGTDTENGLTGEKPPLGTVQITGVSVRVVDGNGAPLAGVGLRLYAPEFRPDSGLAPASVLKDPAKTLVSDSQGFVTISLKAAGKFVVEGVSGGVSGGKTLFYDTLSVALVNDASLYTFRTRAAKSFRGQVKPASGMHIDSGFVFIRGTGRFAAVDAQGGYDLGSLPEDAGRMAVGIRYVSSPTSVQQVSISDGSYVGTATNPSKSTYTCKDVPEDSASRIAALPGVSANDSATGVGAGAKLDTGKVSSALKSCDSLTQGGIVNVVYRSANPSASTDSAGVSLLVVKEAEAVNTLYGVQVSDAVVVLYADCVSAAPGEKTSYDLQFQTAGTGQNILLRDLSEKCLQK